MATYRAVAAVTAALKGVLDDARPSDLADLQVAILQLSDFHQATPLEEGVSILLYRAGVGGMPRTLSGRPTADGRRKLPSLPVDLYYLVTPWARTAIVQHLLLGWLMRTLEDTAILNSSVLNHYGGPEPVFADGETVSLVPEPLALQDLANLWDSLRPNPHVSVAYVARLVHLDSDQPSTEGELVQARDFAYARVQS
jgi:hypothetical protein